MVSARRFHRWRSVVYGSIFSLFVFGASLAAQRAGQDRQPPVPLPGLTAEERARFEEGRRLFEFEFTPRDGLGPVFNARSCAACHHIPMVGGHGPGYRSNIRYLDGQGTQGQLFHDKAIGGMPVPALPDGAVISKRKPPSLLGLGLVEAVPDEAILAHADSEDRDGDGISGRPAIGKDGRLMRFGSQAHVGSLVEFVADALRQELGLTSPVPGFEEEPVPLPFPVPPRLRRVPSPNVTLETVQKLVDFVALLAPPPRGTSEFGQAQSARGENLFRELACAACHVPSFRTGAQPVSRPGLLQPSSARALLKRDISPYSDFLLHDMGPALDDKVSLGVARTTEYRTPPLWGLRFRQHLLLHDGRANNIEQAIVFHDGEGAASRKRYLQLPPEERRALIEFLKTL
jgi:CxxC motif-containing protein (DUF1111 family)